MSSWKVRLSAVLVMLAMLAVVPGTATAHTLDLGEFDLDGIPDNCADTGDTITCREEIADIEVLVTIDQDTARITDVEPAPPCDDDIRCFL
jgi:hypothetical protein